MLGRNKKVHQRFIIKIDTGVIQYACFHPPWYATHELKVISHLIQKLEDNGVVRNGDGPWGIWWYSKKIKKGSYLGIFSMVTLCILLVYKPS